MIKKLAAVAVMAVTLGLAGGGAAQAAEAPQGWVRLAHLSPDTPPADVALSAVSVSGDVLNVPGVPYGTVSDFVQVPAGTYRATMSPVDGGPPVVADSIEVVAGQSVTVAAVGKREQLRGVVVSDDLSAPSEGKARVRLLQASVNTDSVDATVVGVGPLVQGAAFATGTNYAEVAAGTWRVEVTPNGGTARPGSGEVDLRAGTVVTLLVLDNPDGTLSVQSLVDSSAAGPSAPVGGVPAGLGGAAGLEQDEKDHFVLALPMVLLLGVATWAAVRGARRVR
jgi:hypothetical protein